MLLGIPALQGAHDVHDAFIDVLHLSVLESGPGLIDFTCSIDMLLALAARRSAAVLFALELADGLGGRGTLA